MYYKYIDSVQKESLVVLDGKEVFTILRLLYNSKANEKLHKDFYILYELMMHEHLDKAALEISNAMMENEKDNI